MGGDTCPSRALGWSLERKKRAAARETKAHCFSETEVSEK